MNPTQLLKSLSQAYDASFDIHVTRPGQIRVRMVGSVVADGIGETLEDALAEIASNLARRKSA